MAEIPIVEVKVKVTPPVVWVAGDIEVEVNTPFVVKRIDVSAKTD